MPQSAPAAIAWPKSRTVGALGLWLAGLLALLGALPFAVVRYPQMVDYPSHLARYHVMLDNGGSAHLGRFYAFQWRWSGNLGVDLLIGPLARLTGLETAGWLIAALIPVLTGAGLIAIEWTSRRRIGIGAVLAMMAIWSPALRMGFLNFTLALALALLAFAGWIALAGRRWRPALFVPAGLAVWLCHMSGWGVLGLMVLGHEWHRQRNLPRAVLATWPLWTPLVPMLLLGGAASGLNWGPDVLAYKKDILVQALRGDWRLLDIACVGLLILAMVEARSRRALDWGLMAPALLVLAAALALPRHLGGGDFADARLVPVFLMLGCLAIDLKVPRRVLLLAAAAVALRLGLAAATWDGQSRELDRLLTTLDHVPPGARVASAVADDTAAWSYPVFSHIGAYATLRRGALVNAHFALPGVHMLRLRTVGPWFADPSQRVAWRSGQPVDLSRFAPAAEAEYLWYVGPRDKLTLPPGARPVFTTDRSLLVQLAPG
ncbi:MAG: hypothetical protein V4579_02905 [Pseudomonadota bacterium]